MQKVEVVEVDVRRTGVLLCSKRFFEPELRVTGINGLYIDRQQQMEALGE